MTYTLSLCLIGHLLSDDWIASCMRKLDQSRDECRMEERVMHT